MFSHSQLIDVWSINKSEEAIAEYLYDKLTAKHLNESVNNNILQNIAHFQYQGMDNRSLCANFQCPSL